MQLSALIVPLTDPPPSHGAVVPPLTRKVPENWPCGCSRKTWTKCDHPWHFAFQWKGTHYRYSLDRLLGKPIASKTDAETEADRLRVAIKEGTFQKAAAAAPITRETLNVEGLLDVYKQRALSTRAATTRTAFDYAWP